MFERYTDRARRVLVLAQEEARLCNAGEIAAHHVLLGLLHEGEGVAARALENLGVSLEDARKFVPIYPEAAQVASAPFSTDTKTAFELALREALALGHNYIGTEHLLLGLVHKRIRSAPLPSVGNSATLLLEKKNISSSQVQEAVMEILYPKNDDVEAPQPADFKFNTLDPGLLSIYIEKLRAVEVDRMIPFRHALAIVIEALEAT